MRFRRETGDFSINLTLDGETSKPNDVQLPKGLSAEDLLGVFIRMPNGPKSTLIRPIAQAQDAGYMVVIGPIGLGNSSMFYDPATGILSTERPTPPEEEEEQATSDSINLWGNALDADKTPIYYTERPRVKAGLSAADLTGILVKKRSGATEDSVKTVTTHTTGTRMTIGTTTYKIPAGYMQLTLEEEGSAKLLYDPATGNCGHPSKLDLETTSGGGSPTK